VSAKTTSRSADVTGGSSGVGRESPRDRQPRGASVIMNHAGNAERAQEVVEEITAAGLDR
jgi:3-oxoacyl-[acyl-carrier protein] reductase